MARPVIKNIGLRRDRNFSDLTDPSVALTNILNDFVGGDESFESADLITGIEDIHLANIENTDLQKIAGIAFENSYDLESAGVLVETATPLITIKNQFDRINIDTGEPTYFSGGDGLRANFWNSSDINPTITNISTGDNIFIGDSSNNKIFWNSGVFTFSNKLDDTLTSNNGGIQWTGWIMPISTGTPTIRIDSTGFVLLELENATGTLEVVKSIYQAVRSFEVTENVINNNELYVSASDYKFLCVGDQITTAPYTGNSISSLLYDDINDKYKVYLNSDITVSSGTTLDVTIGDSIGTTSYNTGPIYLQNVSGYQPKRIRISVWFTDDYDNEIKEIGFFYNDRINTTGRLLFWYLYSSINQYNDPETLPTFKSFFDNKLLKSGGEIGYTTGLPKDSYKDILTTAPIIINYEPKKTNSTVIKTTKTYKRIDSRNILTITSNSPTTSDIEIGNYVVGVDIPTGTYVTDIALNKFVTLSNNATSNGVSVYAFIDHRGFVKYYISATSSADTVTVDDTSDLQVGMTVVTGTTYPFIQYIRITEIVNGTQFKTSTDLNISGAPIAIYQDKGLLNTTLDNFCMNIMQYTLSNTASSGATTLELTSISGLSVGDYIQASPAIPPSSNTQITKINFGLNSVDISTPTADELGTGSGIIVIPDPSSSPPDKEACAIGLNTAPPFVSTATGLETGTDVSLKLNNGNGKLVTSNFVAENVTVSVVESDDDTYDTKIPITLNGVSFNILASTT